MDRFSRGGRAWLVLRRAAGAMARIALGLGMAVLLVPSPASADAKAGAGVFARKCAECHSVRRGQIVTGPSLAGVVGRKAGSVKAFPYSPAVLASNIVWTAETLDTFIAQPRKTIRGITMTSPGVADSAQRADLIAYLSTLK